MSSSSSSVPGGVPSSFEPFDLLLSLLSRCHHLHQSLATVIRPESIRCVDEIRKEVKEMKEDTKKNGRGKKNKADK